MNGVSEALSRVRRHDGQIGVVAKPVVSTRSLSVVAAVAFTTDSAQRI